MKTILKFLSGLKENNNKEWFDQHRSEYQESKEKMLFMTELFINEIRKFDRDLGSVEAKDCLFRIFRDVRFSNDKSPYKVNMGSFIAPKGRKSVFPGYYFHIQPGECFIGGGCYMPPADILKAIRTEIFDNGDELQQLLDRPKFKALYPDLYDDQLKTAPKGYPADHQHIHLIRYKSYAFSSFLSDDVVSGEEFIPRSIVAFQELSAVNKYLTEAIHKWM